MRILSAFDKFKDSFSAQDACALVKEVASDVSSGLEVISCPLTDGGEGFVEILTPKYEGEIIKVRAKDSIGEEKIVEIGMVFIESLNASVRTLLDLPTSGKLAVLEMASVCGLSDLQPEQRNPWRTSTVGVGELLLHAKANEADCILLGIGGSSTNDAGIGALSALGMEFGETNGQTIKFPSPDTWSNLSLFGHSDIASMPPIRIACDVDNPLLGEDGATKQFGLQKGLKVNQLNNLEASMVRMLDQLKEFFPQADRLSQMAGAGAAGGIGFGLSLIGDVKLVGGFELVSQWLDLENEVRKADLIFTGEGKFDQTSCRGKGPFQMLSLAKIANKKAVLFCGSIDLDLVDNCNKRFPNVFFVPIAQKNTPLLDNLRAGPDNLKSSCRKVLEDRKFFFDFKPPISKEVRFKRIRRVKKFLKPLPRRSNIHRYPVLKWFAETAYKRSYLWSFKGHSMQAALFWGIWISMLPIVGIQMIVVFFVSLLVRANLPLIIALQWISNPLTMGPIYFADYKIGMILINLMGLKYPKNNLLSRNYDWSEFSMKELLRLLDTFPPMFLGGSVLGIFMGVFAVFLYKIFSKFYKK